jgi:hypothetical protein
MATWDTISAAAPSLAAQVHARFAGHAHHILGSLDKSGAPRLSGINLMWDEGIVWFGCMPHSRKIADIARDSRIAVHSAPLSVELDGGDARISGRAHPIEASLVMSWRPDTPAEGAFFEIDIEKLHLVEVGGKDLKVSMWDTASGLRIVNRQ